MICGGCYPETLVLSDVRIFEATKKRFLSSVGPPDENGCTLWGTSNHGYGNVYVARLGAKIFRVRSNRFSWILSNGPIPVGTLVLHRCDVRRCVNPDHLFLGDHKDNGRDMVSKDRHHNGIRGRASHNTAKLSEADVKGIRSMRAGGALLRDVAARFGISVSHVSNICLNRMWPEGCEPGCHYSTTWRRALNG